MTSHNINFRLATLEDAVKLVTLINTAFRDDKTTQVFLSADHAGIDVTDLASLKARMGQPNTALILATDPDSGSLLAHCSVRKVDDDNTAWFGLLAVDVDHQKRGLGGQMLAYAENYVRENWGARRMEFDVVCTRAELIAWYKRREYRETGETRPFPYKYHGDWKGILRDDLAFILFGKHLTGESTVSAEP